MLMDSDTTGMTDEQILLMRTASRFSDEQREPGSRQGADNRAKQAWRQLASLGLIGIAAREDTGGLGGSCVDEAIVAVAIGRGIVPIAYSSISVMAVHLLSGLPIGATAVPKILSGDRLVTVADEEPGAWFGSPLSTVLAGQDGAYRLTGNKGLVLGLEQASATLVTARDQATNETVIVWVDLQDTGLRSTPVQMIDGRTAFQLQLDVLVESRNVVVRGYEAVARLEAARDRAAIVCAAEAVGAMRGALALTREHLRTRRQFEKPLAAFQALRHRFASMAIDVECAESAVFAAAYADADPTRRGYMSAIAKAKCASAGLSVGEAAIQLHGGLGMTDDYAIGRYYKRLLVLNALNGSRDEHLDRLAEHRGAPSSSNVG